MALLHDKTAQLKVCSTYTCSSF